VTARTGQAGRQTDVTKHITTAHWWVVTD